MRTRHVVPAFLALVLALVLSLSDHARAVTLSGQPLSGTASVTSLAITTTAAGGSTAVPVQFLAGTANAQTAIQGGVFWSDTTTVLVFTDGNGGATIGALGITASVPLQITPAHLGVGSPGQPGTGICTVTKGGGIWVTCGTSNAGASTVRLSWTGPVCLQ